MHCRTAQVVRLDIPTGAIQRCALDAAPLRLDADVDKVVVTTEGGRVVLPETCGGAVLPSLGGASTVSAAPAVVLRDRGFQLSERSVDLLLPQSGNPATGRQRVEVTLPAGAGPVRAPANVYVPPGGTVTRELEGRAFINRGVTP